MILKLWKELRLQNQLLIIQILFVSVIFLVLISACVYLVKVFSDFIQHQLLQQLVLNSVVSAIQTAIIRVDMIGMIVYNSFLASRHNLKLLFEFQVQNNISAYSQEDNCLQSQHSQQFYIYQFCYGVYGQEQNPSDFTQIHNFTNLQNQFIPFLQQKLVPIYYNIKLGKEVFLSQYQGQYLPQINQQLLDAVQLMEQLKSTDYFREQLNYSGSIFLTLNSLNNQMYIGALLNQSENPYIQLTASKEYYNQRLFSVLDSGLMLTDSNDLGAFGKMFQNTSVTGFNDEQFQKIKNFANLKIIGNECNFLYKIQILCLVNANKTQQLVFSKFLKKSGFYMVIIVETTFLSQMEKEFNQKLELLINDMFLKLSIQCIVAFLFCIMLQIAFIQKLKRPLQELQSAAKSHINNYQYAIQKITSVKSTQNQTQKLAEAFFNLINLNNINKSKQKQQFGQKKCQEYKQSNGTILRRQSQKIIKLIRSKMHQRFWQINQFE